MRDAIANNKHLDYPDHAGLAYERWAPIQTHGEDAGKLDRDKAKPWFQHLCRREACPAGYDVAFERWRASFDPARTTFLEMTAISRLLIGHGLPAPTEVGITLHHTWGVPVIPGSAIKGVTAHHVDTCYGPDPGEHAPERQPYAGPRSHEDRERPPGDIYRRIFGSSEFLAYPHSAHRGKVLFHDALWCPTDEPFLMRDVLTVHHKTYYERRHWPNDHESPVPVAFITVRPETRFLLAIECDDRDLCDLCDLAATLALQALTDWGVGGKTSAGYGRMRVKRLPSPVVGEFERWLKQQKHAGREQGSMLADIKTHWLERLQAVRTPDLPAVERLLRKYINSKKRKTALQAVIQAIHEPAKTR